MAVGSLQSPSVFPFRENDSWSHGVVVVVKGSCGFFVEWVGKKNYNDGLPLLKTPQVAAICLDRKAWLSSQSMYVQVDTTNDETKLLIIIHFKHSCTRIGI